MGHPAPAGTPPEIVRKVNSALKQSLADPEVAKRLAVIDGEVKVSSPEAFSELIKSEIARWRAILKPDAKNTAKR